MLLDIMVKSFTGILFKAPLPPNHHAFRTSNRQAKIDFLEIFKGYVVFQETDHFRFFLNDWFVCLKNNFWFYIGSKYN